MPTRRNVLAVAAAVTGTSIAGCTDDSGAEAAEESPDEEDDDDGTEDALGAELGVAAEWNAIRSRVDDALALGIAEEFSVGAAVTGDTLARFEAATDEWGAHEQLEETDHDAYEEFEEALEELRLEALDEEDLERAHTEAEIADEQLREAQRQRLSHRNALAFDMGLFAARIADVATLGIAGEFDGAAEIAHETDERWENSIVHDEVSAADGDLYAAFEGELPGLEEAAEDEDLEALEEGADAAITAAFDAAYVLSEDDAAAHAATLSAMQARAWDAAVLASLEGVEPETAADVARGALARFEASRAHDAVGAADHDTYEAFEGELEAVADALSADEGVDEAMAEFADAALRAQFAVAGALEKAPGDGGGHDGEHGHGDHDDLEGGPNVVEGVPDDADHVVEMHAASFEPEELTIEAGETVAFEHVEGEPHTVTAYEDGVPDGAAYWASGGFEDEDAAREGWKDGRGAVVSGQSYVRTFEATGTHEFCCIPHEAAGHVGRVDVE
ncbi:hypothetical protein CHINAEXTREME_16950 [Halobiforma lacisalsi AJ5]|uniref:Blue (Type 1) copper domain-containing protein n=1 Tax=Natronobacterium lacisalsi AJ5 TaxID=358396 RepID=M0LNY3_NATLA|nr:DUF5059 domain-containing protein [Halobiforma lacisalsi]APW99358.1 hypothetical protein CHINAEXTREME_16950 [Halobiforma lacisalsi AJ5]EMA35211.1 blue (type 1) copper domain-containing protein [Halobiforma lacisalsi AJ5]